MLEKSASASGWQREFDSKLLGGRLEEDDASRD